MRLNLNMKEATGDQRLMDVEVPAEDVERGLEEAARGIQRRAALPGFRRGRVPLELVRTQFAALVEQQFLDEVVPRITQDAVEQAKLQPIVPPLVRNLRFQVGKPLSFEVRVDVRPVVKVRDYTGIPVAVQRNAILENEVEEVLRRLVEDTAVYSDLARPAERGDVVVLDSVRLDARGKRLPSTRARSLRIQLGAPDVLPDLENGLLGATAGQERTVTVSYPADYGAQELAGKNMRYVVRVRKIQEKKLRALDDNLAKEVFQLDSLEDLRTRIRGNLEDEERERVRREVEGKLADVLIQRNPFDLSDRLVELTLERIIEDVTRQRAASEELMAELKSRYRPGVERTLRREILLEAMARQEGLSVSDEEVLQEIDRMAAVQPKEAARIRGRYHSPERREGLRERLLERKALERLVQVAQVHEEAVGAKPLVIPATR